MQGFTMKLRIDPGAAVLGALFYFFSDWKEVTAMAVPIAVHELGHLAALKAEGMDIRSLRAELNGFCISYSGSRNTAEDIIAAAAGPAAGIIYAVTASWMSNRVGNQWLALSAGISWILSLFNLLPINPLDGGRISRGILTVFIGSTKGETAAAMVSAAGAALIFACGLWLLSRQHGIAVCVAGAWLILYQINDPFRT